MSVAERTLRGTIARFLRHLQAEENASPHTVKAYGSDLDQFAVYLEETGAATLGPSAVDHLAIRGYLAELHRAGLSKASTSRKLAALRTYFRYLCREQLVLGNP